MKARIAGPMLAVVVVTSSALPPDRPKHGEPAASSDTTTLVSLAPPSARADFAAGIVALHDFWYEEAARRFRAVQDSAPRLTLGYWGEAMALHSNPFGHSEPPLGDMRGVLARLAPTPAARSELASSDHERGYLAALEILISDEGAAADRHPAYADAMAELARAHPDDIEAEAFHARAILLRAPTFGRAPEVQAAVAEAAARVLARDPNHHGGLHYFIHGMDSPATAREAVDEADRYQELARGASHALHMPSHIYMQLGRWDDVIRGNRAAIEASRAAAERSGAGRRGLDHHAMDFLHYALLQQGREREASELAASTRADRDSIDDGTIRWFAGMWSARQALETTEPASAVIARSGFTSAPEVLGYGLHALRLGDGAGAAAYLEEARERAENGGPTWRIVALELEAALHGGDEGVRLLREAIELQAELPRPNETPDLEKPPEELLGELLLEVGLPVAARAAFDASERRWAGRLATRLGRARALAAMGDSARARAAYQDVHRQLRRADAGHPARAEAAQFLRAAGAEGAGRLVPHRVELVEHTLTDTGTVVSSWTYVTVDEGQNWGVPSTVIDWMAATWNGIGQDANVVRSSDLTMLSRVTPGGGGPAGRLLESHYHAGRAAVIDVNPDGIPDGREDAGYGEPAGPDIRRGGLTDLPDNRFYNEIVLPYRFATMDLDVGDRHVLPMFSPYIRSGTTYAVAALVDGRTEVWGEDGISRPAFIVRTRSAASPAEAEAIDFDAPAAEHVFYVSAEPPYFLGKVWTRIEEGEIEEFKTWRYLGHATFDVSPAHRLDDLLEVRRRHTAAEPQELPWDPALGFD